MVVRTSKTATWRILFLCLMMLFGVGMLVLPWPLVEQYVERFEWSQGLSSLWSRPTGGVWVLFGLLALLSARQPSEANCSEKVPLRNALDERANSGSH